MKVFVTGGNGFVGLAVVRRLAAAGHQVVAPARKSQSCVQLRRLGAVSDVLDYADAKSLSRTMAGCEAVVHVAAHMELRSAWSDCQKGNVRLTSDVLGAAEASGVKRFVHLSAASVIMGDPVPILGADESWPVYRKPWLPYSATKAIAETMVNSACTERFSTITLRPPFVWGPGDSVDKELGRMVRRRLFAWLDRGEFPYATCHIDNLCFAISLSLSSLATGPFFVTDGEEWSLRYFMSRRLALSGIRPPRMSVPSSAAWSLGGALDWAWRSFGVPGHPPLTKEMVRLMGYPFSLNISRARSLLGYIPETSITHKLAQWPLA